MIERGRTHALGELQLLKLSALDLRQLEDSLGPLETWWEGRSAASLESAGVGAKAAQRLSSRRFSQQVASGLSRLGALGFESWETWDDPAWDGLPDPPLQLYRRGALPEEPRLAVVGARNPSAYGLRLTDRLAKGVGSAGVAIVSGLARGIDGAAHRAALEVNALTVAVLGAGPDRPYPPEHARLLEQIAESGCVLTEHLPGVGPRPYHFPRRNRLLVALGQALLVTEAKLRSGSLTSVRWAADLGREVLVLPGPVDSPLAEGPLQLLREGATPVGSSEQILEAMGVGGSIQAQGGIPEPRAQATAAEERMLALLSGGPTDLDTVIRLSGESPTRVLTLLLGLETRGLIERDAAMAYRVR